MARPARTCPAHGRDTPVLMHPLPCPSALLPAPVHSSGTLALRAVRPRYSGLVRSNTTRPAAGPRQLPEDESLVAPSIRHRLVHAPAVVPIATSSHAPPEEAQHGRLGSLAPPSTACLMYPA